VRIGKYAVAVFLSVLMVGCSQELRHSNRSGGFDINVRDRNAASWGDVQDTKALRRLESVTWDSVKHELKWEISTGKREGNGYQPHSSSRYEINMDKATMTFNGERRRFSEDEAENVRALMDFVSKYAVESTVWWENGEGDPVDGNETPKPGRPKPEKRPGDRGRYRTVRTVALQVAAE
jgi:hypothetical protein